VLIDRSGLARLPCPGGDQAGRFEAGIAPHPDTKGLAEKVERDAIGVKLPARSAVLAKLIVGPDDRDAHTLRRVADPPA